MGAVARLLLAVPALALLAAAPQRGISLDVPSTQGPSLPGNNRPARAPRPSVLAPAPLPNRDIDGPVAPRTSNAPRLAPSLFTRSDTYRGETLGAGSSAAVEQERKVKPGAGFNFRMPFAPN